MFITGAKSSRSNVGTPHASRSVFVSLLLLSLAVLAIPTQEASAATPGYQQPAYPPGSVGFVTGTNYQVWTNGPTGGVFQFSSNPPAITGLGTPSYTGLLTAAPFVNINNGQANWVVGSKTSITPSVPPYYLPHGTGTDNTAVQWDCYFLVTIAGGYNFSTSSDDGSLLYIGQTQVVFNDRSQGTTTVKGPYQPGTFITVPIFLDAGYHKMTIMWANGVGGFQMSAAYFAPTVLNGNPAANAINIDNNMYVRRLPTPVITPGSSTITGIQQLVTITVPYAPPSFPNGTPPPGAKIYYTTDGTIPTAGSQLYTVPFLVSIPRTITAFVVAPNFDPSDIAQAAYVQTPTPDPTYIPPDGTVFTGTRTVTITSNVPNAFIYYTLDGSIPTLQNYNGVGASPLTLTVSSTTVIQSFAIAYGYAQSAQTLSATYTKTDNPPKIVSCLASGIATQVNVVFGTSTNPNLVNQPVIDQTTANNAANYKIVDASGNPVTVLSAALDAGSSGDFKTVRLTTSPLAINTSYTLTVSPNAPGAIPPAIKDSVGNTMIVPATTLFQYFDRGGLLYERWEGITGVDVTSMLAPSSLATALYPDFPSTATTFPPGGMIIPLFEEPATTGIVSYGSRMSGYFIAPKTGLYQFAMSADDTARFSISSDDNPFNKSFATAQVSAPTNARQWNYDLQIVPENKTKVTLTVGKRYYVEMLHKQDQSVDNAAVAYVFPSATFVDYVTSPVTEKFTSANSSSIQLTPAIDALRIVSQPQDQNATMDQAVSLSFDVSGSAPRTVQWSLDIGDGNGQIDIPGATFPIYNIPDFTSANAGVYQCRQSNLITTTPIKSRLVTLNLVDTIPPTLTSISPALATLGGITNFPATGGNQAVVNGNDFIPGTTVAINGVVATNVSVTLTAITIIVPASALTGLFDVSITKPGGAPLTLTKAFRYDDIPVGQALTVTTLENTATSGQVLTAKDPTDKIVSFKIVTAPTKGTVTIVGTTVTNSANAPYTGTIPFVYTPSPNQNSNTAPAGNDSFTFTANDSFLDSLPQTVTVIITPVNNAPTITNPGNKQVTEDQLVTIPLTGIAPGPATATDEVGQTVTLSVALTAGNANATKSQDGAFTQTLGVSQPVSGSAKVTFVPAFPGTFTLAVTATDNGSNTAPNVNSTTVFFNVTVISVNDAPVITTPGNQVGTSDVSGNITITGIAPAPPNNLDEAQQAPLMTISVTSSDPSYFTNLFFSGTPQIVFAGNPAVGTATLHYDPAFARFGPVTITVTVDDHSGGTSTKSTSFILNLAAVNHAPVAVNDSYSPTQGKVFTVPAPGVLKNDTDPDFNPLTVVLPPNTLPSNGQLTLNANGSFIYTPNANFTGTDSFTYFANDGTVNSAAPATVTFNVGPNLAPIAVNTTLTAFEDTVFSGNMTSNDPNFDALIYTVLTQPTRGTLVLTNPATGAFTYSPFSNLNGPDSFTFKTNDGALDSNVGTLTINVTPVNDAPVATPQSVAAGVNLPLTITLAATDIENDTLSFTITTQPTHGTVSPPVSTSPNTATVTYVPSANYTGPDSFQFTASDASLTSAPVLVSITVNPGVTFTPSTGPSVLPNPAFAGSPVTGTAFTSNPSATVAWNFGDVASGASNTTTGNSVTHVYSQTGVFQVTIVATSAEGVVSPASIVTVQVGLGLSGSSIPPGALAPGNFGFLVGDVGITAGCKAALALSDVSRDKTSLTATVAGIAFPTGTNQAQFVGQTGILTIGTGATASQYVFSLDGNGRAKATGLSSLSLSVTSGVFSFKAVGRTSLTDSIDALVKASPTGYKTTAKLDVPVSLQIGNQVGNQIFMALTLRLNYTQPNTVGKGTLIVPTGKKKK